MMLNWQTNTIKLATIKIRIANLYVLGNYYSFRKLQALAILYSSNR